MKEDVKQIFAQQVFDLIEKKDFEFKTYIQTGRDNKGFRAEVILTGTGVAIKIEKNAKYETHTETEPDPRMFGDTEAVTANAMRDWYPGKTNTWGETKITVKIEALGLPDIDNHEETYKYTETTYRDETKKAVENITEIIERRYREVERETDRRNIAKEADQIKNAFAKIKK